MLKLKKVQILGFKSFCDRTEVQLAGEGIAAIVGPNGCGKSNISDAITWVLGEQSAKSLRGIKMEDVIFAGTRDRKPTGMAEVSLTLVDPEVYDGNTLAEGEEPVVEHEAPTPIDSLSDWDESAVRAEAAQETDDAVIEAQPGTTYEAEVKPKKPAPGEAAPEADASAELAPENNVVLKIRRRKFGRAPVRAGEITITRRLFRSGDSEYLLNGKICRLRDIQDIFMGTGLGGETYAIIGQERIGQLLSSKPLDRRSIIEEAAGITRFKTKKRLAELRLESAKQNLSRVNDIFDEVTRQMGVLKRQASKAERYGALRDELRAKLRVVLASRLTQMDAEKSAATAEIERLGALIDAQAAQLETMDAEHSAGVARGYELDGQIRDAGSRANASAVELERIVARTASNADRVAELTQRIATGNDDLAQARGQLETLASEREQHRSFLESATTESTGAREAANAQQAQAHEATRNVLAAEALAENHRRTAMQAMQRAGQANNESTQAEAALAGLDRENERLVAESQTARGELELLGQQRGQLQISFEDVTARLKRLETEISELRQTLDSKRIAETQSRRRGDELRTQQASLAGRRNSIEALIREHSYSPDTVKNLLKKLQNGHAPLGTLADFLEVDEKYGALMDEYLREELNYVVVQSWDAADEGVLKLQKDVAGRATFLVHPDGAPVQMPEASAAIQPAGVIALRDCVRANRGFGRSLETLLPKLRDGFIAPDAATARKLAAEYPQGFFLAPSGETFQHLTVTGGKTAGGQGPMALNHELGELQTKLQSVETELAQTEQTTATLAREIAEHNQTVESKNHERRDAERESANSGAALRQMEQEVTRIESRLQQWQIAQNRNNDQRQQRLDLIARKREDAAKFEAERAAIEQQVSDLTEKIVSLRLTREELQTAASAAAAALAGLEERRRNANANFEQTNRLFESQSQRITQLESQLTSAASEKQRREEETSELALKHNELTEMRAQAIAEGETLSTEASTLRAAMAELDTKLRTLRHETEALREQRAALTARAAKLTSDLEHLEATCVNDLSVEPVVLREDAGIARIEGEALVAEEEASRALKQRLEAMGPVNMMALEEYTETAERHTFLEAQRKDLLESIENTQQSIKEIDDVSRVKFDEAYKVINENFSNTFTKLFGGGQAFMRLTDVDEVTGKSSDMSGIDIIASPPGKKLQNVLLLSGGEKALTALSLLVGIFQFQPAPFCVLDEVDAPLDETNVGRFARLIAEMSQDTQFVVITHSKRTMEQADVMYGVTMQEPGVSKIVSVSLGGRDRGRNAGRDNRSAA
ncbi:chromosome segregation protein SMC [Granulicella sp. 5B5]|uniref:chromosome segregation protein SMC n=1 Tax=Granulicella sp. 5B5 TaxID=1617967 RepID=UPI0015F68DB6|nr:chromosome segregation protein SMC [Granulicella sp. 5B5]QMV20045.1 chromosome segregation protein SMC [Granulicella sp. 5B5]